MRAGSSAPFSERDLNKLRKIEPVCMRSRRASGTPGTEVRDHYIDPENAEPALDRQVHHAFESFGRKELTPRECEIVGMVLRGHSSESIGPTVRHHHRNREDSP